MVEKTVKVMDRYLLLVFDILFLLQIVYFQLTTNETDNFLLIMLITPFFLINVGYVALRYIIDSSEKSKHIKDDKLKIYKIGYLVLAIIGATVLFIGFRVIFL